MAFFDKVNDAISDVDQAISNVQKKKGEISKRLEKFGSDLKGALKAKNGNTAPPKNGMNQGGFLRSAMAWLQTGNNGLIAGGVLILLIIVLTRN